VEIEPGGFRTDFADFGEAFDAPLCGCIRGPAHQPDSTSNPRELKDMTGPLLPHERERGLGDVDDAEDIRLNLRTKFVEAGIFDRADVAVPGIVGEHIEPSEGLCRYGYGMGRRLLLPYIKSNGAHLVAKPLDQIGELLIARRCNELVSCSEYRFGKRASKATRTTCNQPYFGIGISFGPSTRFWAHCFDNSFVHSTRIITLCNPFSSNSADRRLCSG
jgi:hypothetical protein